MKVNYNEKTIEMTKSEAKAASLVGSDEYKALLEVRKEFPSYRVTVKAIKTKNVFKGMDYDFMVKYIKKLENAEENLAAFNELKDEGLTYGEIKKWFVKTFPVFKDCETRADWILAAVKKGE